MVAVHDGGGSGRRPPAPAPPPDGAQAHTIDVEPHMIPELAATFAEQAEILSKEIDRARRDLKIHKPWLGDPVSVEAARLFNKHFTDDALSLVNVLTQLVGEYKAHREALMAAAKRYNMTEHTNAALLERGLSL
ncbi:PE domain-containing protein [Allokutzneria albata]|uniref:Uncharacterized protein n=1 Tax=Allokutzneria albata TaxID=211114 RepID=A0A1H0B6X8_ALLAB|nr:PE domain-containing protein [Allokutzneria albata]SDN41376.1 hypothetical protein SAMN04489726_6510 [Allokutzneria albata]